MDRALGEIPDEPRIHGPEQQIARLGLFARAGHVLKNPADFRAGKIGVEHEPRLFREQAGLPLFAQAVTEARSTPVLPDDGVVHGRAGPAVPDDGGLALVGDAHRRDFRTRNPRLPKALGRNHRLAVEKFVGVVLHPAGLRIVLREFLLGHLNDVAGAVEQDGA